MSDDDLNARLVYWIVCFHCYSISALRVALLHPTTSVQHANLSSLLAAATCRTSQQKADMYTADAAVRGLRGVPNEIAVLGASNYLNETLRPGTGGSHARTHHFTVDRSPAVAGRGKITEERARSVCTSTAQASATLQDAFHQAATLSEMTAPVHIRDLKDVAQRTTDEMVERETEVSGPVVNPDFNNDYNRNGM